VSGLENLLFESVEMLVAYSLLSDRKRIDKSPVWKTKFSRPDTSLCNRRAAPTGPRSRGYAPQNRTAVEFGKQRLVAPQGVLVGIGPQPQAAAFQDMRDPPANAVHDPGDFGITRRPTPFSVQP
jgi:hypothetical protein